MSTLPANSIRKALEQKFDAVNAALGVPSVPPAREGVPFDPAKDANRAGFYCRLSVLRAGAIPGTIGVGGAVRHDGIFQISVFCPIGKGTGELLEVAESLATPFTRATLSADGVTVQAGIASLSPVLTEPKWLHVAISVPYYAFSN